MAKNREIEITPPGADQKGFLRRLREITRIEIALDEVKSNKELLKLLDDLIAVILEYVSKPKDAATARELLLDASQAELFTITQAIKSGGVEEDGGPKAETAGQPEAGDGAS